MPRRVNLPGADELFRSTAPKTPASDPTTTGSATPAETQPQPVDEGRGGSGRVKHDEKMTVYMTSAELMAIEQARLTLRGELGRNVDRGRLVRAALAIALTDLDERGVDSEVARRLREVS